MNRALSAFVLTQLLFLSIGAVVVADESTVSISQQTGKFVVTVGGQPFCEVDYGSYPKPVVYPIYGPGQVPMTRNHPMVAGVAGEAADHPHHKSMWFGHGDINGVSFWDEKGKTVTDKAEIVAEDDRMPALRRQPTVRLHDRLVDADGNLVCRETIELSFGASEERRWIDWHITEHAGDTPLVFGDTKEGTAALRVHPNLRPDNRATKGTAVPPAEAVNSEGDKGPGVWGKSAKWVDYSGTVDGHLVGIAFFDHPKNFRHPTYWHARPYGLFAANPFGLSHFVGSGSNGSHSVPAGQTLEFRYRIVLHAGNAAQANVERLYEAYTDAVK